MKRCGVCNVEVDDAVIKCPECGHTICKNCGNPIGKYIYRCSKCGETHLDKKAWLIIAITTIVILIPAYISFHFFSTSLTPNNATAYPEVQYVITGTAQSVDVTLNNSTGGTEQYDNVPLPVTYTCPNYRYWFIYCSAQNQGQQGSVIVSIYVDGKLFKTSNSSGAYVIASASGSK